MVHQLLATDNNPSLIWHTIFALETVIHQGIRQFLPGHALESVHSLCAWILRQVEGLEISRPFDPSLREYTTDRSFWWEGGEFSVRNHWDHKYKDYVCVQCDKPWNTLPFAQAMADWTLFHDPHAAWRLVGQRVADVGSNALRIQAFILFGLLRVIDSHYIRCGTGICNGTRWDAAMAAVICPPGPARTSIERIGLYHAHDEASWKIFDEVAEDCKDKIKQAQQAYPGRCIQAVRTALLELQMPRVLSVMICDYLTKPKFS